MNKIEYLNALKDALKSVDIKVMEEIVADYEEHFQVGLENGKSEEQICEELGSIDDLVKEINEAYHVGGQESQAHAGEGANNRQEHSSTEGQDKWYYSHDADKISNAINRVLDSTSNAINHALQATSEAIGKVDVAEIGNRLKSTMERAASHLNDLTDNYCGRHPGSFDANAMNAEYYQDNITKSYDNSDPGNQKMNLVVDGLCADIRVRESADGKINIRYENNGNERLRQKYAFYSFMEGNTVYAGLRMVGNAVFLFNMKAYAIVIYLEIPEGMGIVDIKTASGDIGIVNVKPERLFAETASGDLSLAQVGADELKIKSASGDIRIEDGNGAQVNAHTLSGDIEAKRISAGEILLKSTSGDVDADNMSADTIDLNSLSGSLDIAHASASECKIKSTSGDVDIQDSSMKNADVSSISGGITLSNIAGENLSVKSTSGDVNFDANVRRCWADSKSGDVEAVLNGDVTLESSSTSGNIRIRLKNFGNGYAIKSRTVSGNLSVHYNDLHQRNLKTGTYTYGNQGSNLTLSSVSGDIQVND
jgi:DUF4097 and DUF4098 domain-containing protein YvlB